MTERRDLPDYASFTRAQTLADNEDLDALCRWRPLDTAEIFLPNAAYGHDLILKRWADWPRDRPLRLALLHGIEFGGVRSSFGPREHVPVVTYADPSRIEVNRKAGVRARQWAMAMPYAYLLKMLPVEPQPERRGTLFFPVHSTPNHTAQLDWEEVARSVLELPGALQPVTVCIYYRDHALGRHLPFLDAGIPVVSAGAAYDPFFLARLHHHCERHEFVATNDAGSAPFYAIFSGCRLVPFEASDHRWEGPVFSDEKAWRPEWERLRDFVAGLATKTHEEQIATGRQVMGEQFLLDPKDLRHVLRRAEAVDWLPLAMTHSPLRPPGLPSGVRRRAARLLGRRQAP